MKKLFTLLLLALVVTGLRAQDCAELFFSEYADGQGNDKYLEIFNPTNSAVDLSNYGIVRFRNGATLNTTTGVCSDCWVTPLQGSLAAGDVFLVVNGQTEDVPLGGGATSPGVSAAMRSMANYFDCIVPYLPGGTATPAGECYGGASGGLSGSTTYMNGDDAIALLKVRPNTETGGLFLNGPSGSSNPAGTRVASETNWTVIDLIGEIGYRPNTGWGYVAGNDCSFGSTPGPASERRYATSNNTLVRKASVKQGVRTNPNGRCDLGGGCTAGQPTAGCSGFNAAIEWDSVGYRVHHTMGWHVVESPCFSLTTVGRTRPVQTADVSFYPNPVGTNGAYVLSTAYSPIVAVQVQDVQGRVLRRQAFGDRNLRRELSTVGLTPGVYLLQVQTEDNAAATLKMVVR
jgi:hypothetical protein